MKRIYWEAIKNNWLPIEMKKHAAIHLQWHPHRKYRIYSYTSLSRHGQDV
jgi:hypothetical protein